MNSEYPEWMEPEIPTVHNPYSLAPIKAQFKQYEVAIKAMEADAGKVKIKDDPSNKNAVAMAGQAKKLHKQIESLRKEIVKKPNEYVKAVNTFTKSFKEPLENIEQSLKGKIGAYQIEQERKRREAERKARETADKLRRKLEAEARIEQERLEAEARKKAETEKKSKQEIEKAVAEVEKIESIIVPEVVVAAPPKVTRTESGSASLRKVWAWKEIDFAKIPDEYKAIDVVKVNTAVKAGIRNIPGIEIFEEYKTVLR